jgi:hypothetical protein
MQTQISQNRPVSFAKLSVSTVELAVYYGDYLNPERHLANEIASQKLHSCLIQI